MHPSQKLWTKYKRRFLGTPPLCTRAVCENSSGVNQSSSKELLWCEPEDILGAAPGELEAKSRTVSV
jgi:hypothetical protein